MHFSLCYILAPAPSIPGKLFWQRPAINSCLGKSLQTFSGFILSELFPLTISSLMAVFFFCLLARHSLLVLGLICWPLYFQAPLECLCFPGFCSGPSFLSSFTFLLANTLAPWLRPILHSQQAQVLNFLISSNFFYFIFFCKNYFYYAIKHDLFFHFVVGFFHEYSNPPAFVTCHTILCVQIFG